MVPVKECLGFKDDEVKAQVQLRRDLINRCVGTLYPGILCCEIQVLQSFIGLNTLERMALIDWVK